MINGKSVFPPKLYDLLQNHKTGLKKEFNAVKPGIIQSYDGTKRTATIQVAFKRVLQDGSAVSYPILLDCPVFTIQGGGAYLAFPIAKGDECLVLFGDSNIDAWFQLGGQAIPFDQVLGATGRRHDLSDGFAVVGLNSLANPILATFGAGEAGLANKQGALVLMNGSGKIKIANNSKDLVDVITGLTTTLINLNAASGDNSIVGVMAQLVTILVAATIQTHNFDATTITALGTISTKLVSLAATAATGIGQTATDAQLLLY